MPGDVDYKNVFERIRSDARYQRNVDWGEARPGHPEGTIRAHIGELEENLQKLRAKVPETDCWRLRLLIHTHDTFKAEAKPGVPIASSKSHASLARAYLAEFCDDAEVQAVIQYHDEPYALWRQFQTRGKINEERLVALIARIRNWNLFLAFNIIDGCTTGKDRAPLRWFFGRVAGRVQSSFSEADIL